MGEKSPAKQPIKHYYRKRVELFRLIDKIKLWPSRKGLLHGIKVFEIIGDQARITTQLQQDLYDYQFQKQPGSALA